MLRTDLCDLVGIDVPVIEAGMSIFTSPGLAATVSNAGGLGSLGAWRRPAEQLRREINELRDTTGRPFALNHVVPDLDPAGFELTLELAPAVVSFALDDGGELMKRVHDAGSLVMQQITTVQQAAVAAERGADIIVAQGGEAGGYGGSVATLALVPQVVDAVRPVPVVAAGGMADGRGLAAALVLGAAGVNLGTRFLASQESPIGQTCRGRHRNRATARGPASSLLNARGARRVNTRTTPQPPGFRNGGGDPIELEFLRRELKRRDRDGNAPEELWPRIEPAVSGRLRRVAEAVRADWHGGGC